MFLPLLRQLMLSQARGFLLDFLFGRPKLSPIYLAAPPDLPLSVSFQRTDLKECLPCASKRARARQETFTEIGV